MKIFFPESLGQKRRCALHTTKYGKYTKTEVINQGHLIILPSTYMDTNKMFIIFVTAVSLLTLYPKETNVCSYKPFYHSAI